MGRIGLIDVDGHNFPNLALMRTSAFHKSIGDTVEWWWSDLEHYDIVYKSKVFSDSYSSDVPDPVNADKVYKGGTGYQITFDPERERAMIHQVIQNFLQKLKHFSPITVFINNMILQFL